MITKIEMTAAPDRNLKDADCQTPSQGTVCRHGRCRCRIGHIVFPFARFGWAVGWAALAMAFDRKLLASVQRTWNQGKRVTSRRRSKEIVGAGLLVDTQAVPVDPAWIRTTNKIPLVSSCKFESASFWIAGKQRLVYMVLYTASQPQRSWRCQVGL